MIVQTAAKGAGNVVIPMREHGRFAGKLARAFGNEGFATLRPFELLVDFVDHHDDGWDVVDPTIGQDIRTGLPYSLVSTPLKDLLKTGAHGPNLNEARHRYAGLLSSMHTVGLYTGRYGLSDKVLIDKLADDEKPPVLALLEAEKARQTRLTRDLEEDPVFCEWVREPVLMHQYKALQFFDTLALYFHMTHDESRTEAAFANVPRAVGDDVTVTLKRLAPQVYELKPFPFRSDPFEVSYEGKLLAPQPFGVDIGARLHEAPRFTETLTLRGAPA